MRKCRAEIIGEMLREAKTPQVKSIIIRKASATAGYMNFQIALEAGLLTEIPVYGRTNARSTYVTSVDGHRFLKDFQYALEKLGEMRNLYNSHYNSTIGKKTPVQSNQQETDCFVDKNNGGKRSGIRVVRSILKAAQEGKRKLYIIHDENLSGSYSKRCFSVLETEGLIERTRMNGKKCLKTTERGEKLLQYLENPDFDKTEEIVRKINPVKNRKAPAVEKLVEPLVTVKALE
jgi:predicted transcriptional regulator